MKKLLLLLIAALPLIAQTPVSGGQGITPGNPPGGAGTPCTSTIGYLTAAGDLYTCAPPAGLPNNQKTWTKVGSSGAATWPPSGPTPAAPPILSSWTFINTASAGSSKDVQNGVLLNSVTGNDIKQLTVATPGASGSAFTATAHISGIAHDVLQTFGMVIGLATDSKIHVLEFGATTSGQAVRVSDWNSSTSFAATVVNYTQFGFTDVWMRIKYDGTNIILSISPTGQDDASFMQIYSVPATGGSSFLGGAPAKIGFFAYSQVTGNPVIAVLDYWSVTQP